MSRLANCGGHRRHALRILLIVAFVVGGFVVEVTVGAVSHPAYAHAQLLETSPVDEAVAAARGVPVRLLGVAFLALVGVVCAESTQAVGGLLVLGLIAAPAGAAHRLTSRPYLGILLSAVIGVGAMWAGLAFSFYVPTVPPSFSIMSAAALAYVAAAATTTVFGVRADHALRRNVWRSRLHLSA